MASAWVDVDAALIALDELERDEVADGALVVLKAAVVEVTRHEPEIAYWETAVLTAETSATAPDAAVQVDADDLRAALVAGRDSEDRAELAVGEGGELSVGGRVVARTTAEVPDPPRPGAGGVQPTRIELPRTAPVGVAVRTEGLNVMVPEAVGHRFSARMVSLMSLFESPIGWFMSGVVDGQPTLVVVGAVGVY